MIIHQKAFREELYIEHLEEAAFQYEKRLAWLEDEAVGWQDLEDTDNILEAHIDALIIGDKLALAICLAHVEEADFAVLHIIVRVLCRLRLFQELSKIWGHLDFEDKEKIKAVADALKWDCPKELMPHIANVFARGKVDLYPIVAPSFGYHSPKAGDSLLSVLHKSKPQDLLTILKSFSFGGEGFEGANSAQLKNYLTHSDKEVAKQVAIVMLMMGQDSLPQLRIRLAEFPCVFAIAGSLSDSQALLEIAKKGLADENCLLALGLSGNLESIPHLIAYLDHPDYAPTAAQALELVSGASLFEDAHVADKVEEDELFEHELESFKSNELPKNIDGQDFGVEVHKLSIDRAIWFQWFQENKERFVKGVRYRNGNIFSASELLKNLIDNQTPYHIRQLAYQELVIRFRLNIRFCPEDLVSNQKLAINQIHQWIHNNKTSLAEGRW